MPGAYSRFPARQDTAAWRCFTCARLLLSRCVSPMNHDGTRRAPDVGGCLVVPHAVRVICAASMPSGSAQYFGLPSGFQHMSAGITVNRPIQSLGSSSIERSES